VRMVLRCPCSWDLCRWYILTGEPNFQKFIHWWISLPRWELWIPMVHSAIQQWAASAMGAKKKIQQFDM
jgi:hypothetical protein